MIALSNWRAGAPLRNIASESLKLARGRDRARHSCLCIHLAPPCVRVISDRLYRVRALFNPPRPAPSFHHHESPLWSLSRDFVACSLTDHRIVWGLRPKTPTQQLAAALSERADANPPAQRTCTRQLDKLTLLSRARPLINRSINGRRGGSLARPP